MGGGRREAGRERKKKGGVRLSGLAAVRAGFCRQLACETRATGPLASELPTADRQMHAGREGATGCLDGRRRGGRA